MQHITDTDYASDVKRLGAKVKRMVVPCFETYRSNSPAGVASLSELVEGMVMKAASEAAKKGWMPAAQATTALANVLINMRAKQEFGKAQNVLSGAGVFVSRYRNSSHHFPSNQKKAHLKYRDCRHGFLEGVRILQDLQDAFKEAGLSGGI